jgi:TRAP-type C4-dicarboxylate transport system permease small subunit
MAVGLFVIAATVVLQVILSNCFNSSITGANEIITKLFVYVTTIGAAVAVGKREHIAITFATDRMPTNLRRLVEILGLFLVAVLNMVVVAYSIHWIRITGHYLMPTTQLPRFVAQLSVPIGSAIAILFCLVRMFSPAECEHAAPTEPKP